MNILTNQLKKPLSMGLKSAKEIRLSYAKKNSVVHPNPVIILGHLKSGTSAITMLIGKATGERAQNDIFCHIKDKDFREDLYNRTLRFSDFVEDNKYYFSAGVLKDPHLTYFYDEITDYFSKSKFVFIVRDPRINLRSILNYLKLPGDLPNLADSHTSQLSREWQLKLEGKHPSVQGNSYIETLAYRWKLAAETYIKHQDNLLLLRYEDFLKDKAGTIYQLAREVGLSPKYDISKKVNVQYQKGGNPNTDPLFFFGPKNLSKIESICADEMNLFGYSVSAKS